MQKRASKGTTTIHKNVFEYDEVRVKLSYQSSTVINEQPTSTEAAKGMIKRTIIREVEAVTEGDKKDWNQCVSDYAR